MHRLEIHHKTKLKENSFFLPALLQHRFLFLLYSTAFTFLEESGSTSAVALLYSQYLILGWPLYVGINSKVLERCLMYLQTDTGTIRK